MVVLFWIYRYSDYRFCYICSFISLNFIKQNRIDYSGTKRPGQVTQSEFRYLYWPQFELLSSKQ
jgi:hypothetical protein